MTLSPVLSVTARVGAPLNIGNPIQLILYLFTERTGKQEMRPSAVRMGGEMPGGKHYMGWWGDMGAPKQRGIIQYGQSSFRQAPMRGAFKGYLFNGFSRIAGHLPYVVPPFAIGYGIYSWAKRTDAWMSSKAAHLAQLEHGGGHE